MTLWDILFSFKGRLRRRDWWLWGLVTSGLVLVAYVALTMATVRAGLTAQDGFAARIAGAVLTAAVMVAFVWMQTAVTTKRVHDVNLPAWPFVSFQIAAIAVHHALIVIDARGPEAERLWAVAQGVDLIGWAVSIVVLGFTSGTAGDNPYGPSPKGPGEMPAAPPVAHNGAH